MSNHSNHLRCVLTVTLENMSVHAPVPLPPLQNNSQYCMKHPVVQPSGTCSVREDGREVGGSSPARELVRLAELPWSCKNLRLVSLLPVDTLF